MFHSSTKHELNVRRIKVTLIMLWTWTVKVNSTVTQTQRTFKILLAPT